MSRTARSASQGPRWGATRELGLARPGIRGAAGPVVELHDRVARLELMAWVGWQRRDTPALLLLVVAECGLAVARARVQIATARSCGCSVTHKRREQAATFQAQADSWSDLARRLADLRTAHGPLPGVAAELPALARVVRTIVSQAPHSDPVRRGCCGSGWDGRAALKELGTALDRLARAAEWCRRWVVSEHTGTGLLIRGQALEHGILSRRHDLLRAKLSGVAIQLPTSVIHDIDAAYRRVLRPVSANDAGGSLEPGA